MAIVTKHGPAAIPDADYFEVPEETSVAAWSPDSVPGRSPPTQVHMMIGQPPGTVLMVRFTSPRTISALIDALVETRDEVWPNRCSACRGIGDVGGVRCGECGGKGWRG